MSDVTVSEPDDARTHRQPSESDTGRAQRIVALARRHLRMDVAYVSEFAAGADVYRFVDGSGAAFGIRVDGRIFAGVTFDRQLADGAIPPLRADRSNTDPAMVRSEVSAYVGVPLVLSDGTVFGTFCALSRKPAPLDARDLGVMALFAELLVRELDEQHASDRSRERIVQLLNSCSIAIAFQPIIDVRDGCCLGVEALSRFPSGFGSPDTVFATARTVALGTELEVLALKRAISFLPLVPPDQFLALNLTPEVAFDLARDPSLSAGLPLDRLVLEVTENMAMQRYREFRERLAPLRERGLRLAIDDAGAGYASLYHIIELQPDIVKIDRSIVSGVDRDRSRRSAIRAFVAIAADLGASVVAEGIETVAELDTVRELGVDAGQGYLLAQPSTDTSRLAGSRSLLPAQVAASSSPRAARPVRRHALGRKVS
ncbi:EAL domain-containing protein (putative c-di-GMP-specific phosphodiesterase class I) [Nakamurella sp. UYEF19]|uniref:EAL domain-containing protein n=1 Tax=Nakamurella sp. UYEF19 TaxID=1756392 RepID=UPI003397945C